MATGRRSAVRQNGGTDAEPGAGVERSHHRWAVAWSAHDGGGAGAERRAEMERGHHRRAFAWSAHAETRPRAASGFDAQCAWTYEASVVPTR